MMSLTSAQDYFRLLGMDGMKSYFRCLFRALRDIHARGIIHRDVKPANFLFDPRTGVGTLCDFGLACVSGLFLYFLTDSERIYAVHGSTRGPWRVSAHTRNEAVPPRQDTDEKGIRLSSNQVEAKASQIEARCAIGDCWLSRERPSVR